MNNAGSESPKAGVMGWPVEHSLSPRLHGWWLARYGIEGSYVSLPVPPEGLAQALKQLPAQGFRGVNLTVPHKEAAIPYLDRIDPLAHRIGAVNTVEVCADGALEGRNTDSYGFMQNLLAAGYKPGGRACVILGAGGASRAAVAALLDRGVGDIRIVNRTPERAKALIGDLRKSAEAQKLTAFSWDEMGRALEDAELLVNATSLGMRNQPPLVLTLDPLPRDALVTDMVYAPLETALLKEARSRGNPALDGLGMLLHQARPAFAAFFGVEPEVTEDLRRFILTPEGTSSDRGARARAEYQGY